MLAMVLWARIGFLRHSRKLTHGKPVNLETLMLNLFKGHTMKNTILDILSAVAVGLMLCIGLLAYFDILIK
jgi:hypothetical protein